MTSPHKILHLISDLDGYGLCRQMELLVESQFRLCKPVKIMALRGDRKLARLLRQHGFPIQLLDRRWVRDPFVAARLVAELRKREYDLLHVWGQAAADYVDAVQRLVPQVPQVPRVTTLSDENLLVGISIPPSVKKTREKFCAELHLPADAKLIAVAGRLLRSQQIDEAIWHFELVRTLDESVRLLIFGDGPDQQRLERFTRLTSEPAAVRFLGYRRNVRQLLPHADVFWHTAEAGEATPQGLLEAMAAGVPVVANDTANCRRVIDHGQTGYLVANNDRAIFARYTLRLLQELDEARDMGMSSVVDVAERFAVEDILDDYHKQYENSMAALTLANQ